MKEMIREANINLEQIHESLNPESPPWEIIQPTVLLNLTKFSKSDTSCIVFYEELDKINNIFYAYKQVYTDGSKDNEKCGCCTLLDKTIVKRRLPGNASIFSGEATAIDLALDLIADNMNDNFVILSDSLSVLFSIHNKKLNNPLIVKLLDQN